MPEGERKTSGRPPSEASAGLPVGIHAAWNFAQGDVFGVSVSGTDSEGLLEGGPTGPDLLCGGVFGAEASVVTVAAGLGVGAFFVSRAVRQGNIVVPYRSRGATERGPA